ncbi:alpha/beta hydrolase family protein [Methylobrevis albus]|uniref:Dienelactone hydrolase n=1 Tax=Methylobrevis albus TaxID=2793297 RepID=A0A931MY22_9HYPH|nr:hypothetical protein [Methylobrevis albus]MBH0237922.1 hypothetical protein [Methylobrevis albus]
MPYAIRRPGARRAIHMGALLAFALVSQAVAADARADESAPAGHEGDRTADALGATAGYDRLDLALPHRAGPVAASVWYPVGTPTYGGLVGDNPVFRGTPAFVGAAPAEGRFPLLVVSHGSGGNMDNLGWLSSALALRGVMVLAVNHPGSTSGDSSPRRSIDLAARARDLTAALDALLADPAFGPRVDRDRIAVLGFSLGGSTALQLAGARLDRGRYRDYCTRFAEATDCVFFGKGGVDLAALPESFEAELRDPRIRAAVAVDPGMSYGFTPESVLDMHLPVLLVDFAPPDDWTGFDPGLARDVGAAGSGLALRLPEVERATIGPAIHFSFLGLCKPEGAALLEAERDDPVCTDPAVSDRAAVHEHVTARITAFLKARL